MSRCQMSDVRGRLTDAWLSEEEEGVDEVKCVSGDEWLFAEE